MPQAKNRTEAEYREALQVRKAATVWFSKLFEQYDAMLTPSALAEAPLMGSTGDPICCTLFFSNRFTECELAYTEREVRSSNWCVRIRMTIF